MPCIKKHWLFKSIFLLNNHSLRTGRKLDFHPCSYLNLIEKHISSKYISNKKRCPWMSISLKRLIRKKQRLYKCTKHYNSDTKWKEYKDINKQVRNQIRQQHTNYLSNTVFSNGTNSKKLFWRYIKTRKKTNESVNCLKSNTSS